MEVSKTALITSFANGRFPTGQDFENLIDSCYNDGSSSTSLSALSGQFDNTYTQVLSANSAEISQASVQQASIGALEFATITTAGEVGIDASIIVSLQPSGSAILYFQNGILVQQTNL